MKLSNNYNCSAFCPWGDGTPFIFSIAGAMKQARKLEVPSEGIHSYPRCSTLRKHLHGE